MWLKRGQPLLCCRIVRGFQMYKNDADRASQWFFLFLQLPLHPFQAPLEHTPAFSIHHLYPSWIHSSIKDERILPRIFLADGDGPPSCQETPWDAVLPVEWLTGWESYFLHVLRTVAHSLTPEFEKIHLVSCRLSETLLTRSVSPPSFVPTEQLPSCLLV